MSAKTRKQKLTVASIFIAIQMILLGILRHAYGVDKVSDFNMVGLIEGIALIYLIDRTLYGKRQKHDRQKKPKVIKEK